eukprot:SM000025S08395  [mRNA]  locus=s25:491289:494657:+ [translate_table: standard]
MLQREGNEPATVAAAVGTSRVVEVPGHYGGLACEGLNMTAWSPLEIAAACAYMRNLKNITGTSLRQAAPTFGCTTSMIQVIQKTDNPPIFYQDPMWCPGKGHALLIGQEWVVRYATNFGQIARAPFDGFPYAIWPSSVVWAEQEDGDHQDSLNSNKEQTNEGASSRSPQRRPKSALTAAGAFVIASERHGLVN